MAEDERRGRDTRAPEMVVISVTVRDLTPVPSRPIRDRVSAAVHRHRALTTMGIAVALAILAATLVPGVASSGPAKAPPGQPVSPSERTAIAGALGYPYPLFCLSITILSSSPDYARAHIGRTNGCARYRGYTNASLHRARGRWRLVLDEGQLFVPNRLLSPRGGSARAGGAAGQRYPLGCLSAAIALHDPRFARAALDRTICPRPGATPPLT